MFHHIVAKLLYVLKWARPDIDLAVSFLCTRVADPTKGDNIFYQDNESAMKLERNGRASCSNKTRHIHIRYFFVNDVLEQEDIELKHCKTDKMIADFYTKPLQGKQFLKLRGLILGHVPIIN